jgi:hypothetical protein
MRINRRTVIGIAATALVLAGAIVAGSHVGELVAHRESERVTPTPSQPAPAIPQPRHEPSPTPSKTPTVRPTNPADVSTGRPLFNLRNDLHSSAVLDIPASSGCPARTLRLNGNSSGSSRGVNFFIIDEPLSNYGDLTGDGHEEAVLGMGCAIGKSDKWTGFLLVLTATSATTYQTRTAMPLPPNMHTLTIKGQRVRISNAYPNMTAATVIREYKLSGSRLVQVS